MLNRIIQKYINENRPCIAWKIDNDEHLHFCELYPQLFSNKLITFKVPEYSLEVLFGLIGSREKVLLLFEDDSVIEVCEVAQFESNQEIILRPLNDFVQLNRRTSERLNFKKLIQVRIENQSGHEDKYYGHDLSENGLSVVLTQSQGLVFKEKEVCHLKMGDKNPLKTKIEVVSINKLKPYDSERLPYSKYKVAFRFVEKNNKWIEALQEFAGLKSK